MEPQFHAWVGNYGYAGIFAALMLGIVGLPVPDETLLAFTGYLIYSGELKLAPAYGSAVGGSACGITVSYLLGKWFGIRLLHRYGRYIHLGPERLERAHPWFERAGKWSLTIGYFIPGVRHFTAYAAAMAGLEYRVFALYAYGGAVLWAAVFIALGYFLGEQWEAVGRQLDRPVLTLCLVGAALAAAYVVWRKRGRRW